jgi:hypothetical protein
VESISDVNRRPRKEKTPELKHYLGQDWRFANQIHQIRAMGPGRIRDKAIETFLISIYSSHSLSNDPDSLRARSWALTEYTQLLDEEREEEGSSHPEIPVRMKLGNSGSAGAARFQEWVISRLVELGQCFDSTGWILPEEFLYWPYDGHTWGRVEMRLQGAPSRETPTRGLSDGAEGTLWGFATLLAGESNTAVESVCG